MSENTVHYDCFGLHLYKNAKLSSMEKITKLCPLKENNGY